MHRSSLSSIVNICIPGTKLPPRSVNMPSVRQAGVSWGAELMCLWLPRGKLRWLQKPTAQSQNCILRSYSVGCYSRIKVTSGACSCMSCCLTVLRGVLAAWRCVLEVSRLVFDFSSRTSVGELMKGERRGHCESDPSFARHRSIVWLRNISRKWVCLKLKLSILVSMCILFEIHGNVI